MNRELIEKANLQTFHAPHGLPPADYVEQEMQSRGGGYDAVTLREQRCRILSAESVNGLALVILLRKLDKDDPTQQGFITVAHDLTGAKLYRTGSDGAKLPKSAKTGYREYGDVAKALGNDTGLVVKAIQRECDAIASRHHFLTTLLEGVPEVANDTYSNESGDEPETAAQAAQASASAVAEPDAGERPAVAAAGRSGRGSRAQGSRRE